MDTHPANTLQNPSGWSATAPGGCFVVHLRVRGRMHHLCLLLCARTRMFQGRVCPHPRGGMAKKGPKPARVRGNFENWTFGRLSESSRIKI